MSCITVSDVKAILLGTELSGNSNAIYRISFNAVANSGFSFGVAQLDIGSNGLAQQAYAAILDDALAATAINQPTYNRLIAYNGHSRYDLDPNLSSTYQSDKDLLNTTVFSRQAAHNIIDTYTDQYITGDPLIEIQNFLDAMDAAWGTDSVFAYNNAQYALALAAITSIDNRFGNLNQTTVYFQTHQPSSIGDVRDRFMSLAGANQGQWDLVEIGANLLSAADPHYTGVANTISLASAVGVLGAENSDDVVTRFLKAQIGNCIDNVDYVGSDAAGFLVGQFTVSGAFSFSGGIFLSSGGFPGSANTSSSFSVSNNTPGDVNLTATAHSAFPGAGVTHDASVVSFTFENNNPNVGGIKFDVVFGSDEYPEFSDTSFVDVAAIYVNGVNYALFNNNSATPLSVTSPNVSAGNFVNNTGGAYGVEWDGFSHLLTIRAPVHLGDNLIKIGVADTGDSVYDSGLYIKDIKTLTEGGLGGGVLNVIDGDDSNNHLFATNLAEEINIYGGANTVSGSPSQLNGDVITEFGEDDLLVFDGVQFGPEDLGVTFGSAILAVDTNDDGSKDTTVTLTGNFQGSQFTVSQGDGSTEISVKLALPTSAPVITSNGGGDTGTVSVAENITAVTKVVATDAESDPLTFSISGGADQTKFAINASTGDLAFVATPNFESPADVGADNVYNVTVQVSDGTSTDQQQIAVTVTNVNEPPVITSNGGAGTANVSIAENTSAVTTVVATDPDAGTTLTYSITGDADSALFSIGASSGALAFASAPNFEIPGDLNGDNVFEVAVGASDGVNTATQHLRVAVTDVTVGDYTGSNGPDFMEGTAGAESMKGFGGNDTLLGNGGNDNIQAGTGNDVVFLGFGTPTVLGGDGADFLFGGSGNDNISGEGGNDRISGSGGNDTVNGGTGNDTMGGGADADSFAFDSGFGQDIVTDFSAGDKIALHLGAAFDTFEEVHNVMSLSGGNTILAFDANNSITLLGVKPADLHASDFIFS